MCVEENRREEHNAAYRVMQEPPEETTSGANLISQVEPMEYFLLKAFSASET